MFETFKINQRAKVVEALVRDLEKKTPDEIAAFLQEQGIKGRRAHCNACPIARYIKRESGAQSVSSIGWSTAIYAHPSGKGASRTIPHQGSVREFIHKFDMVDYPDLVEPW